MPPLCREPLDNVIARAPHPQETWLWCLHCERFFQVKDLVFDGWRFERCPFEDCGAIGLDFDIFLWNDFRAPGAGGWPTSEAELRFGMRSPDMTAWTEEQQRRERTALVAAFLASDEATDLGLTWAPWTDAVLATLQGFGMPPSQVDAAFLGETLADLGFWVDCEPGDAPAIVRELRGFFGFAARGLGFVHGRACATALADHDLPRRLRRWIRAERDAREEPAEPRLRRAVSR